MRLTPKEVSRLKRERAKTHGSHFLGRHDHRRYRGGDRRVPGVMPNATLTGKAIQALLGHLLAGAAGGSENRWRRMVGPVEILPIWEHSKGNWRVSPTGSTPELDAIATAVEVVRAEHPFAVANLSHPS